MRPSPIWFFPTLSRLVLDVLPIVAAGAITVYLLVSLAARPGVSAADKGTDGVSVELPASAELSGDALTAMVWADQKISPAPQRQTAQPAPDASAPSQAKAVPAATAPAQPAPTTNAAPTNATPARPPQRTAAPVERRNPPTPPQTQQTAQPSRPQQAAQPPKPQQATQAPRTLPAPLPTVTVNAPTPAPVVARAPAPIEPPMPIPTATDPPPAAEPPAGLGARMVRTATGWGGKAVDAVVSVPVAAYNVGRKTVDAVADVIRP